MENEGNVAYPTKAPPGFQVDAVGSHEATRSRFREGRNNRTGLNFFDLKRLWRRSQDVNATT